MTKLNASETKTAFATRVGLTKGRISQLVAEGLGVGFIRQGYQKNIHYPKPVKYYTIDISRYGQDVVVAYRRDVELTKPMRAMIMQMKDAAEEYLKL